MKLITRYRNDNDSCLAVRCRHRRPHIILSRRPIIEKLFTVRATSVLGFNGVDLDFD